MFGAYLREFSEFNIFLFVISPPPHHISAVFILRFLAPSANSGITLSPPEGARLAAAVGEEGRLDTRGEGIIFSSNRGNVHEKTAVGGKRRIRMTKKRKIRRGRGLIEKSFVPENGPGPKTYARRLTLYSGVSDAIAFVLFPAVIPTTLPAAVSYVVHTGPRRRSNFGRDLFGNSYASGAYISIGGGRLVVVAAHRAVRSNPQTSRLSDRGVTDRWPVNLCKTFGVRPSPAVAP